MHVSLLVIIVTWLAAIPTLAQTTQPAPDSTRPAATLPQVSDRVHIFYYDWYGAPPFEPGYVHWTQGNHTPPEDIGSNYYPKLGPYSSADPAVLKQHMAWLRQARVGVITLSWWGRNSYEDNRAKAILNAAAMAGLKVNFHLEPYKDSTPESFLQDIAYITRRYGRHPAFYHYNNKAVFYFFESNRHSAAAWRSVNDQLHDYGQPCILLAQTTDLAFIQAAAFDGGYTYDGLAPFKHPDFLLSWTREIAPRFKAAHKLFIPSVGPGYIDDRAVPNGATEPDAAKTRNLGQGSTYDAAWAAALATNPPFVSITSFNEWHEGSQIEPAASKEIPGYTYPPYPGGEDQYLTQTASWVEKLLRRP